MVMRSNFLIVLLIAIVGGLYLSVYIVDERQKAMKLRFGRVTAVREDPGLYFKIPFVEEVALYDDRILSRDVQPLEVTPLDDRRLVVDAFARYRIVDVEQFREATGASGVMSEDIAGRRLDSILNARTREILGSVTSGEILSSDRAALMARIRDSARSDAEGLGLQIIDVRLKRTDLPDGNLQATYDRMAAERQREAADEIARGNEAAQRVRAQADRTQVEIVSDARRQSEIIRGEADATRNGIFAKAFGADVEFFEFYRSLSAYERALKEGNSTMVISPDSPFFDYLQDPEGSSR